MPGGGLKQKKHNHHPGEVNQQFPIQVQLHWTYFSRIMRNKFGKMFFHFWYEIGIKNFLIALCCTVFLIIKICLKDWPFPGSWQHTGRDLCCHSWCIRSHPLWHHRHISYQQQPTKHHKPNYNAHIFKQQVLYLSIGNSFKFIFLLSNTNISIFKISVY